MEPVSAMNNEKTPFDRKKEHAAEGLHEVSAEDSEPAEKGVSEQKRRPNSQQPLQPSSDIDDGGPLSI